MDLRLAIATLLMVSGLVACGDSTNSPDSGENIASIDTAALFSPATDEEREAILSYWATRTPQVDNVTLVASDSGEIPNAGYFHFRLYSHKVDGLRQFFAAAIPDSLPSGSKVLLQCHGGDMGLGMSTVIAILMTAPDLAKGRVHIFPVFRSEQLLWTNGSEYWTEGSPSPWDRDVDDAIAAVHAYWSLGGDIDTSAYDALGFSRGGGVALLAAIRDPAIASVVDFFGPADFQGEFIREKITEILAGEDPELPGAEFLDSAVVQPLVAGSLAIAQARLELVARSPAAFAEYLPPVQIHHGLADSVVPVSQSMGLWDSIVARGDTLGSSFYTYEGGEHDPTTLNGSVERTIGFLSE